MKVISLATFKGGVGKSSLAIAMTSTWLKKKKRILLIDLDQQANTTMYVGANRTTPSIYDVLHAKCAIEDAIQHLKEGYDMISASQELSKADREFVDDDDCFLLADVLEIIKDKYDYVVIDNAPAKSILLTMSYVASDGIIVPTEADDGGLAGIQAVYDDLIKVRNGRRACSHAQIIALILNKSEKTIMHQLAKEDLVSKAEAMEETPIVDEVRKSIVMTECKRLKTSVQEYAPDSNTAADCERIAIRIMKKLEAMNE